MSLKAEEAKRLNDLNQDPEWFQLVCARIANGEILKKVAEDSLVTPSVFRIWIAVDEARETAYVNAQRLRTELRNEILEEEVRATAMRDVDKISGGEKLKAAEMLLNPKAKVSFESEGGKVTIVHESA